MSAAPSRTDRPDVPFEWSIGSRPITLHELDAALGRRLRVSLSPETAERIRRSNAQVQAIAAGSEAAYGINTGFGHLCTKRIAPDEVAALQRNLILSHAVGVGEDAPRDIVRWMMLLKAASLSHGVSGVSPAAVQCLLDLLNHDLLPTIPTQGSLGASGDLAPLAHMVLPMIGEGRLRVDGTELPAAEALRRAGVQTVTLGPKDGLALINGTQFMAAYAAHVAVRAHRLVKHCDIVATMSLEGLMGSVRPFDGRLHAARPHPGAIATASNVRRLMAGSEILPSHANCGRVQDPYSLRCVPQVHGASREALHHASGIIETEINSVTDNPLIFDDGSVVSGGLFHGQHLALALDYLAIALAELGSISERRIYLLLSGAADLPTLLMRDTGINSGFMLPQYTAAALVSENKGLCMPSSVDSIPTSLGQEDHVSMGARAAVKCRTVLENTETVLAIEQMCAAQALDYRAPLLAGMGPRSAHQAIRRVIDHAEQDRSFGDDIRASLAILRGGKILTAVESAVGLLE